MRYMVRTITDEPIGTITYQVQTELNKGWMVQHLSTSVLPPRGTLVAVVIFQAWEREGEPK